MDIPGFRWHTYSSPTLVLRTIWLILPSSSLPHAFLYPHSHRPYFLIKWPLIGQSGALWPLLQGIYSFLLYSQPPIPAHQHAAHSRVTLLSSIFSPPICLGGSATNGTGPALVVNPIPEFTQPGRPGYFGTPADWCPSFKVPVEINTAIGTEAHRAVGRRWTLVKWSWV